MSSFAQIYKQVKPSIVAIAAKISRNPQFPTIIGTGFVAREDGIILTNDHVVNAIKKLPRVKGKEDEWPIVVLMFKDVPGAGMAMIDLKVDGVGVLGRVGPIEGAWYGEDIPDVAFITVEAKGLEPIKIPDKLKLTEGDEVMVSGFPMGTDTLRAPGWVHQLTPVLQSGVICSVLPFPCDNPHELLIDVMTQGGSSGSPVLNPDNGDLVGILYGGLVENKTISGPGANGVLIYENNTSLSTVVPVPIVHQVVQKLYESQEFASRPVSEYKTIDEMMQTRTKITGVPREAASPDMIPLKNEDVIV